ncbi:MAG: T9SS type A sorting domain-containing protein [Bacteroidetes bacterium]|nr:T9SS type A sorting domain-containing protein [Bacteroidota bacterium]
MKKYLSFILFIFVSSVQFLSAQSFNQSNIQQPTCFGACNGSVTFTTANSQGPYTAVLSNTASCPNSTLSSSSSTAITISGICACASNYTVSIYTGSIIAGVNYVQFPNYATAPLVVSVPTVVAASCATCCNGSAYITWTGGNTTFTNNPPSLKIDGVTITAYNPANNLCVGSHTVCAKDSSQCVACKTFSISYNVTTGIVFGAPEIKNHVTIFPNPVSTELTIDAGKDVTITRALVIDLMGREVIKETFGINGQGKVQVNVSSLPEGLYYVEVYAENRNIYRKRFAKKDN